MSAPLPVGNGYLHSPDVATGSAVTLERPGASTKQQFGPTKSLPIEVLLEVFHLMTAKQVHAAALVCSSWRTAAVAATTSISVQFRQHVSFLCEYSLTPKAVSLQQWIARNGAGVQKISIGAHLYGKLALPLSELQQLRELSVSGLHIALWGKSASSTAGSPDTVADVNRGAMRYGAINHTTEALDGLSLLTGLTKLSLDQSPAGSFNMLSALTRLQDLYLTLAVDSVLPHKQGTISTAALQQLTRLTSLSISPGAIEHSTTGGFSNLTNLQKLAYICMSVKHIQELKGLPGSLTRLKAVWGGGQLLTRQVAVDLAKLTSLQHVELSADVYSGHGGISPCVIRDMTQLTYLALLGLCPGSLGLLLSAMGGLLQLRHLDLSNNDAVEAQAVQQDLNFTDDQYAALTASSHLTYLAILSRMQMFRDGVGEYIFPPGRQLPDLKILRLGMDPGVRPKFVFRILNQQALDRILCSCPAIEQLSILGVVDRRADKLVTTQFSGLTKLAISGRGFRNSTINDTLLRLTRLSDLMLMNTELTELGLWEMTTLTRLTRLEVRGVAASADRRIKHGVCFECSQRHPTPVWQQLQALYRDTIEVARMLLDRAEAVLTESRHCLAATHQQLSAVQQLLQRAMQADPAEQQLQLEEVQQQLMAAVKLTAGVNP